ncbi:hypothetical protein DYB28_000655 [Aphanomyces astaci]|uniref:CRAL-TRIO domain-containing protein n=1 Tax=Aphanomyces astaci TaxID=112090 RepID=A0A9X8E0C6_APHAT|nr:hypothetical protein DYB28_000655 [Aphanomyces astaci]
MSGKGALDKRAVLASFKDRVLAAHPEADLIQNGFVVDGFLDSTLTRYLEARNYVENDSMKMITETLAWRQQHQVATIMERPLAQEKVDALRKYHPQGEHGVDRDGNILYVERMGYLDAEHLMKHVTLDEAVHYHIQKYEFQHHVTFKDATAAQGRVVNKMTVIYDMQNVGLHTFKKVVFDFVKQTSAIGQDHYPDTLSKVFIVNAPFFFFTTWKLVEVFLNPTTRKKIHFLGGGFKNELVKHIDPTQLPKWLGGICECFPSRPHGPITSLHQPQLHPMGRGKQLNEFQQGQIVVWKQHQQTVQFMAQRLGVSQTAIRNYLMDPENYGKRYKGVAHQN